MDFGLFGLHRGSSVDPDVLSRRAAAAERVGFESLWVGDHVVLPAEMTGSEEPRLEALSALTYLAAVTTRVRLAAGVVVVPQRQPVLLAKQLACIDVLSKGRLIVGVGVGHIEPELAAFGVDLSERGERTDEYLDAVVRLWAEEPTRYDGRWVRIQTGMIQRPRPLQSPHPPIIVGGRSRAALRRAAQLGNGWFGWLTDLGTTAEVVAELEELIQKGERPAHLGPLEITVAAPGQPNSDLVEQYSRIGVTRLIVGPDRSDGSVMDEYIESASQTFLTARK